MISKSIMKKSFLVFIFILGFTAGIFASESIQVMHKAQKGAFPLVSKAGVSSILIDASDAEVTEIVANALAGDLEKLNGKKPNVITLPEKNTENVIIAGTIGQSKYIDLLVENNKIDISQIKNKWESYLITTVYQPFPGIKNALIIAGSDRRGTAFGMFELSRMVGVSPWVWWADVVPRKMEAIYITSGTIVSKEPDVKYRGIFINDEDWGLNAWASRNIDTDIRDIGPKTYALVFELLLRMKANFIWPAMHDSTNAFFTYPMNPVVADKYAIVMGSTHCDQMLRSNTCEWNKNFEKEYGVKPGEYRYDTNKKQVYQYWDDRVRDTRNYESVYTMGMRGVRDGGMSGPAKLEDKIALLDTIIADQRTILKTHFGDESRVPQIFIPYKEVLTQYKAGLKVPDDVTLIWTDDNFGYLRQLSTPKEQLRSGSAGIYYHLSYLGGPHDYIWLSSNSPALISYEMSKAYQFGANRLWVVNVGDLKPAEMETQFFLDLAFDTKRWEPQNACNYAEYWAEQNFGAKPARKIAEIKNEFYRLAQMAKPEHMGIVKFDSISRIERLKAYTQLITKVDKVKKMLPESLLNAYFQLIEYPVKGAALMNSKILYAQMSFDVLSENKNLAGKYSLNSKNAFLQIKELTRHYNKEIENGKWDGIISYMPRNLSVYGMPKVAVPEVLTDLEIVKGKYDRRYLDTTIVYACKKPEFLSLPASAYRMKFDIENEQIITIKGLGLDGKSVSRFPTNGISFKNENYKQAPYVEYDVKLSSGNYNLSLKCLPTQQIHGGRSLAMAVVINNTDAQFVAVNQARDDRKWKTNLLRGYSDVILPLKVNDNPSTKITIYLLDTGLVLSRLDVTK
jgi:hypothetical protein